MRVASLALFDLCLASPLFKTISCQVTQGIPTAAGNGTVAMTFSLHSSNPGKNPSAACRD